MTLLNTAPATHALTYLDLYDCPAEEVYETTTHGVMVTGYDIPAATLARFTPAQIAAITPLVDTVDEGTCSAIGCEHPVGWVLREDDERPHASGCSWFPLTLVTRHDGTVAVVCEDCSPSTVYAAPYRPLVVEEGP